MCGLYIYIYIILSDKSVFIKSFTCWYYYVAWHVIICVYKYIICHDCGVGVQKTFGCDIFYAHYKSDSPFVLY